MPNRTHRVLGLPPRLYPVEIFWRGHVRFASMYKIMDTNLCSASSSAGHLSHLYWHGEHPGLRLFRTEWIGRSPGKEYRIKIEIVIFGSRQCQSQCNAWGTIEVKHENYIKVSVKGWKLQTIAGIQTLSESWIQVWWQFQRQHFWGECFLCKSLTLLF